MIMTMFMMSINMLMMIINNDYGDDNCNTYDSVAYDSDDENK